MIPFPGSKVSRLALAKIKTQSLSFRYSSVFLATLAPELESSARLFDWRLIR
jgi:hypothetical protein